MIQRIQSVYLFVAALLTALIFFFPFAQYLKGNDIYIFDVTGVYHSATNEVVMSTIPVLVLPALCMILALVTIFMYKRRMMQMRLGSLNIFLYVILIAAIFFYSDRTETFLGKEDLVTDFGFGTILPILCIILTFFANRAIKKDEALVRAADRIR
jgi:hypothetical protein